MAGAPRLVILEDDPGVRLLLRSVAETSGWSVEHGSCASDIAHALPYADAVTIDVHLRGENGLDVLRRLRRDGNNVPAIVLSGDERGEAEAAARSAGATHFMLKPFEVAALSTLLDEVRPHPRDVVIDLTGPEPTAAREKSWFMS